MGSPLTVTVLGSAGDSPIPLSLCNCVICEEAKNDPRSSRTGPGYYINEARALVDTSEDIRTQLVKAGITAVSAVFYSHFHPDHTLGYRWVWSLLDESGERKVPPVSVYLPENIVSSFKKFLGLYDALQHAERGGVVKLLEVPSGESIEVNGVRVTPIPLACPEACGFLFESQSQRILIIPDESYGWKPPPSLGPLSVAVIPVGICQPHPITGKEPKLSLNHPILCRNNTFYESLRQALSLDAEVIVFSHIEHHDGVTSKEFVDLEEQLSRYFQRKIVFANDNNTF